MDVGLCLTHMGQWSNDVKLCHWLTRVAERVERYAVHQVLSRLYRRPYTTSAAVFQRNIRMDPNTCKATHSLLTKCRC